MNIHQYRPTKPVAYNTTKSLVRSVVSAAGGPKRVAQMLGCKREQRIYEMTDPDCPAQMSLDAGFKLTTPDNRVLAERFAAKAGCVLMPMAKPNAPINDLVAASVKEHAEFVCIILRPHADNATDRLAKIKELHDAIRALTEVCAALIAE